MLKNTHILHMKAGNKIHRMEKKHRKEKKGEGKKNRLQRASMLYDDTMHAKRKEEKV